jgi:uncharacterized protein (DUF2062 family)
MISNPWVLAGYFPACVVLGQWMLGVEVPRVAIPDLNLLLSPAAWRDQGAWLKPLMLAWAAGAGVVTIAGAGLTYPIVRTAVVRHRRAKHREPPLP